MNEKEREEEIDAVRRALRRAPEVDGVKDMRAAFFVRTVLMYPFAEGATVDCAGVGDGCYVVFDPTHKIGEGCYDEGGHVTYVSKGCPLLAEAAELEGVKFIS
jgi:hypothetical protein